MRQQVTLGALAGGVAGLAMLVCALGLDLLGQHGCLAPWLILTQPAALTNDLVSGMAPLAALAPGVALHESAAAAVGVLGVCGLARWPRHLAATTWLVAGILSMVCFDAALLALCAPGLPLMLEGPQALEYVVFGLVLVALALARVPAAPAATEHGRLTARGPGGPATPQPTRPSLQVVVAPHCFGCARARALATEASTRFPALEVRVLDLDQPDIQAPPGIVAIPAYVLDGRVVFTGNPTPPALWAALATMRERGEIAGEVRPSVPG